MRPNPAGISSAVVSNQNDGPLHPGRLFPVWNPVSSVGCSPKTCLAARLEWRRAACHRCKTDLMYEIAVKRFGAQRQDRSMAMKNTSAETTQQKAGVSGLHEIHS